MCELTVYYCPKCAYYGYYVSLQNAVCPHCMLAMKALSVSYKDFMQLDYDAKKLKIAGAIGKEPSTPAPAAVKRVKTGLKADRGAEHQAIAAPELCLNTLLHSYQELSVLFNQLRTEQDELLKKYQESEATVQWMHDMIWDLTNRLHKADNDRR